MNGRIKRTEQNRIENIEKKIKGSTQSCAQVTKSERRNKSNTQWSHAIITTTGSAPENGGVRGWVW